MSSCVISHPELLVPYLFVEPLLPEERLVVRGLLSRGTGTGAARGEESGGHGNGSGSGMSGGGFEALCVVKKGGRGGENEGEAMDMTPQAFFSGLRREMSCFVAKRRTMREREDDAERSTTISSKSSILARLASNLSLVAKTGSRGSVGPEETKVQDVVATEATAKAKRKKKSRFEDRLREALTRGDTPDSEQQAKEPESAQQQQDMRWIRQDGLGSAVSTPSSSGASGDSSYSFNCALNSDTFAANNEDPDLEPLLLGLVSVVSGEESRMEERSRAAAVAEAAREARRRAVSAGMADVAARDPLSAADGTRWSSHVVVAGRRANSECINRLFQERRDVGGAVRRSREENADDGPPDRYAWVVRTGGALREPTGFLLTWLAVSMADIPLLIFQVPAGDIGGDEGGGECAGCLEQLFQLCGQLEQKGWNAKRLLEEMLRYLHVVEEEKKKDTQSFFTYFRNIVQVDSTNLHQNINQ